MSLIACHQKNELDPIRELLNTEHVWAWGNFPAIDVAEDKDRFIVRADLPGMKKEDIRIAVEEGILLIEGERKNNQDQQLNYYRVERAYGRFARNINLGTIIDVEKVQASYEAGVLEILLPKSEKAKARTIAIS